MIRDAREQFGVKDMPIWWTNKDVNGNVVKLLRNKMLVNAWSEDYRFT